jgi:hypothetical protein
VGQQTAGIAYRVLLTIPRENMGPVEVLNFLKRHDCFPNVRYYDIYIIVVK